MIKLFKRGFILCCFVSSVVHAAVSVIYLSFGDYSGAFMTGLAVPFSGIVALGVVFYG